MKRTIYLFGLNAVPDYRRTEVRLWSCERNEDDIKMTMYEYLCAAETKKKSKVKIRNKRGEDTAVAKPSTGGLLSPPPSAGGLLSPPRGRGTKTLLPPPRNSSDIGTNPAERLELYDRVPCRLPSERYERRRSLFGALFRPRTVTQGLRLKIARHCIIFQRVKWMLS